MVTSDENDITGNTTIRPAGTLPRPRIRLFHAMTRLLGWLPRRLKAAHMAIWLGFLDGDDLNELTAASYDDASGFGTGEHNIVELWPWEQAAIAASFGDCRRLLIAAAGGGREAIALAKKGFAVTAFDSSGFLTAACKTNADSAKVRVEVLHSRPDQVPSGLGEYDGLVVGRGAYHHIPGRGRRVRFLQQCGAHLSPGAPVFVGDFQVRQKDAGSGLHTVRAAKLIRRLRRSRDEIDVGDTLNQHQFFHRFAREEVEAELSAAGFRLECFEPAPFDQDSSLAFAIARWCPPGPCRLSREAAF
jgi:2-polyprenyl-3-methyl-5-hydroxy-6-metoxy-1,4-benzoquinol methylase